MATTTSTAPAAGTTPAPGAPGATTVPTSTTTTSSSAKAKLKDQNQVPQTAPKLSANELERVTEVFKMYETGLREATIYPKVSVNSFSTLSIGNWKKCEDGMNHDPLDSRILMGLILLGIIKRGFEEL